MLSGGVSQIGLLEQLISIEKWADGVSGFRVVPRFRSEHISKVAVVHKKLVITLETAETFDQVWSFWLPPIPY